MTTASRLYAGIAALALVLAGFATVAPSSAKAATSEVGEAALIGGAVVAAVLAAVVLAGGGDGENPQSP